MAASMIWKRYAWAFAGVRRRNTRLSTGRSNRSWRRGMTLRSLFLPDRHRLRGSPGLWSGYPRVGFSAFFPGTISLSRPRFSLRLSRHHRIFSRFRRSTCWQGLRQRNWRRRHDARPKSPKPGGREIAMLYRIGQIVSGESDPDRMTRYAGSANRSGVRRRHAA